MSNINGPSASNPLTGLSADAMAALSPDAIISFCASQLNNYAGRLGQIMAQAQQGVADQQIVSNLQNQLVQMGPPTDAGDMQTAYNAYQTAISQLPAGDPVAAQLQQACTAMCSTYGYTPPEPLTPARQAIVNSLDGVTGILSGGAHAMAAAIESPATTGVLAQVPTATQWTGTTDAVGTIGNNLGSESQLTLLEANQISSMDQTAVEQATQLCSTENATANYVATHGSS